MKITILDVAERDLEDGFYFYEKQSSGLGSYFLDSTYADIDSLKDFKGIHAKVFGYHRLLSKRFPFAVYYRTSGNEVLVVAVLDCRRKPSWVRKKLMDV